MIKRVQDLKIKKFKNLDRVDCELGITLFSYISQKLLQIENFR